MSEIQIINGDVCLQPVSKETAIHSSSIIDEICRNGYCHVRNFKGHIRQLLEKLGHICMTTNVVIDDSTKALVTSEKPLGLHTDHSRVKFIAWHCILQSSVGGESLLLDARNALDSITLELREELSKIHMFEHQVFEGDPKSFPLLSYKGDIPSIYYSFWLADDYQKQARSFNAFVEAIARERQLLIRLEPGDLLVIDNKRMLHGRTEIKGDRNRFLRRYWISEQHLEVK